MCDEQDLQDDGFTERFKFDSTPPQNVVLRRTPSLEDFDYSSAAIVNARVIDDQDDATSPPPTRIDTAPSSSTPPNLDTNPASPTPSGNE